MQAFAINIACIVVAVDDLPESGSISTIKTGSQPNILVFRVLNIIQGRLGGH